MQRAYGTLTTIKAQQDAILAAQKARIPTAPKLQAEISSLLEDARTEANKRNNIAHGIIHVRSEDGSVIGYGVGPPARMTPHGRDVPLMWFLAPPSYNSARNRLPGPFNYVEEVDYRYNTAKIRQIADKWETLIQRAYKVLAGLPSACQRSDEQFREYFGS
jgi:hypothetical protein